MEVTAKYRRQFLRNQKRFNTRYRALFNKVADDIARLVKNPNVKFARAFEFPTPINAAIDAIILDFQKEALKLNIQTTREAWDLSNQKNDEIVNDYFKTFKEIKEAQKAAYLLPNFTALEGFLTSRHGSETLSESVWKIAEQLRAEMQIHLGLGIMNGDSADVISRRIRQYLKNPDALFRRVRDKNGNLVPSRAMKEYHPGQGVYKSAYKNAMRVARTNTNQAYLLADHMRWQQLDMVKGVHVALSEQHPEYNFPEICEELEGDYPKAFIFVGWHPQCLCHAEPILMAEEDFMKYLEGGPSPTELNNMVTAYPPAFVNYLNDNYERFTNYKTVPYWIQDNTAIIQTLLRPKD